MSSEHKQQTRQTNAQLELEWFFCRSSADINVKSNYSAMVNAAVYSGGGSHWTDPYNDSIIESVTKLKKVERVFYQLSDLDQKVLFVVHSFIRIHPLVEKVLSCLHNRVQIGAVAYLLMDPDKLEKTCTKAVSGELSNQEKILLTQFRIQQANIYQKALKNYINLKYQKDSNAKS